MLVEASLAGNMFDKVHKYSKAFNEQYCETTDEVNTQCFKVNLYNAYAFYFEKDLKSADEILSALSKQAKKITGKLNTQYQQLTGDVAFERNKFLDAKNHYNNFLKLAFDNEIRLKLGMSYYHLKKYSKAKKILSQLEKENYKNNLLYRYLGLIAFGKEKYDKALIYFKSSDNSVDKFFTVHTLIKLNRTEDAFNLFRELVNIPVVDEKEKIAFDLENLIDMRLLSKAKQLETKAELNENLKTEKLLFQLNDLLKNYLKAVDHLKKYAYLSKDGYKEFYKVAEYYLTKLNDLKKATEYYNKVIETDKEGKLSSIALLNMIKCSLYLGEKEKTLTLTTEFLKKYGTISKVTDEVYFILGKLMLDRGNYEEAIKSFENIVTNYPESSLNNNSLYFLGESYFRYGMYKDAVLVSEKYQGNRFKTEATFNIAMGSFLSNNYNKCIDFFNRLNDTDKSKVDINSLAYSYALTDNLETALKIAKNNNLIKFNCYLLAEKGENALSFALNEKEPDPKRLFRAHIFAHDLKKKELVLLKCAEYSDKNSTVRKLALIELDSVVRETKDYISLMELNSDFVKNDPTGFHGSQAILKKARKYREKGKISKAISLYKMAVDSYPLASELDEAYYFLFQYSRPVNYNYLQTIINNYQEGEYFALASYKMGLQQFKNKDYSKCIINFENALQSDDESIVKLNFFIHYYLGIAYEKSGKIEKAIHHYKEYLKLVPDDVKQYGEKTRIALLFQKNRLFDNALTVLETIKDKVKNNDLLAEITYYIAECYEGKNMLDKALENYLAVTYLHSSELMWSTTARFKAASICEKLEYYDDAIKLYSKIASAYKGQVQGKFAAQKVEELKNKK
jgi:tetratricopeptide (TPR) repeat protein